MILPFLLAVTVSLYDLRTRRIPNWCTLPLLLAGLIAHWPGHLDLWLATWILLFAWAGEGMASGDVKLWLALLWMLPTEASAYLLIFMFASFLGTGLIQLLWRIARRQPLTAVQAPAAWRTLPFLLLCWHVH
jgi:Flp pilus assembly protein protease CpaA